ncbi:hypothetical protein HanIR_Chr16g0840041 [Helianthus annuus]|nr:hypothetical protein HanIR_Chr16g0840041 [Helianthus annuus]
MVDIMVFYDFLHFVEKKMDFVANSHPIYIKQLITTHNKRAESCLEKLTARRV